MCEKKIKPNGRKDIMEIPIYLKENLTVDEAVELTGLSAVLLRSEAYLARARPRVSNFPAFWVGNKLLIPRLPLINWLAEQGRKHSRFDLAESRELVRSLGSKRNNQEVNHG